MAKLRGGGRIDPPRKLYISKKPVHCRVNDRGPYEEIRRQQCRMTQPNYIQNMSPIGTKVTKLCPFPFFLLFYMRL